MKPDFEKWLEKQPDNIRASIFTADEIHNFINQFAEDYAKEEAENCCVEYKQELLKEIEVLKLKIHNLTKPPFGE